MKREDLIELVNSFEKTLNILNANGLHDSKLRSRYAEFLVALILAERGHNVQVLNKRDNSNADIYMPDKGIRVEVKSGLYKPEDDAFTTDASFGHGEQIGKKFDFCVFVTFNEGKTKPEELFVFSSDNLKEVKESDRKISGFPETNPCLLLRYRSYKEYEKYFETKEWKQDMLKIEIKLHKHPEEYQNWDIIK